MHPKDQRSYLEPSQFTLRWTTRKRTAIILETRFFRVHVSCKLFFPIVRQNYKKRFLLFIVNALTFRMRTSEVSKNLFAIKSCSESSGPAALPVARFSDQQHKTTGTKTVLTSQKHRSVDDSSDPGAAKYTNSQNLNRKYLFILGEFRSTCKHNLHLVDLGSFRGSRYRWRMRYWSAPRYKMWPMRIGSQKK